MKAKSIMMKDRVHAQDGAFLRGEMIFGTGRHLVDYTNPYGVKSQRTLFDKILHRNHNIVPIGGYQYVFDKLFNIGLDQQSTLRVGKLNDEAPMMKIGVTSNPSMQEYNAEVDIAGSMNIMGGINLPAKHFIFGFMIGDGGAREDNITAIAPDYKNRTLYNAIPFRMSNDGYDIPDRYYGKAVTSGDTPITSYYIKLFDEPAPHIVHAWASDNHSELDVVDDSVFSSTSSIPIESYVEINLSIDELDGRGYFGTSGQSPRINEFGLVAGWKNPAQQDYENLIMITHFTRPSLSLPEGDEIEAIYRIYAR